MSGSDTTRKGRRKRRSNAVQALSVDTVCDHHDQPRDGHSPSPPAPLSLDPASPTANSHSTDSLPDKAASEKSVETGDGSAARLPLEEERMATPSHEGSSSSTLSSSKRKKKKKKLSTNSATAEGEREPVIKHGAYPSSMTRLKSSLSHIQTVGATSTTGPSDTASSPASGLEHELEWCIAQLEVGLLRSDASKSQKQENDKYVRLLRSEKTALPRKRQIMKNLFGDYRSRLIREPLPRYTTQTASAPSISQVREKSSIESKGRFFKKSVHLSYGNDDGAVGVTGDSDLRGGGKTEPTSTFCFNFEVEP